MDTDMSNYCSHTTQWEHGETICAECKREPAVPAAPCSYRDALQVVAKSVPQEGSLGQFVKAKLAITEESFCTHAQLVDLAGSVIAFLSHEYGEHLPGERTDVEQLIEKAQKALRTK